MAVLLFDQVTLAGDFSPLEYKNRRSYFWFRSRYGQPFQQKLLHVQRTVKSDPRVFRKESEGFGRLPDMRAFVRTKRVDLGPEWAGIALTGKINKPQFEFLRSNTVSHQRAN